MLKREEIRKAGTSAVNDTTIVRRTYTGTFEEGNIFGTTAKRRKVQAPALASWSSTKDS